jgi:hypothetical protein
VFDTLLRRLVRTGFRRGFAGEHWAWLVLAGSAWLLRRARTRPDPLVLSMPMTPGERYLVTISDPGAPAEPADAEAR